MLNVDKITVKDLNQFLVLVSLQNRYVQYLLCTYGDHVMLVPVCAGGDWRLGTEVPLLPSSSIQHLDPPPPSSILRSPLVRHTWGHLPTLHLVPPLVEQITSQGSYFVEISTIYLEHKTKVGEDFTITEKAPTRVLLMV